MSAGYCERGCAIVVPRQSGSELVILVAVLWEWSFAQQICTANLDSVPCADATKDFSNGCALRRPVTVATLCKKFAKSSTVSTMSSECDLLLKSQCVFGKEPNNSALISAKDRCLHNVVIEMRAMNISPNTHQWHSEHVFGACCGCVCDWLWHELRLASAHVHCKS